MSKYDLAVKFFKYVLKFNPLDSYSNIQLGKIYRDNLGHY